MSSKTELNFLLKFSKLIIISLACFSCANQLPPSGGQDDSVPPKIISVYPKANTVNFKDNKIILKFDEYIDRRSFEESFFISPSPEGEINFDWSGKEVEINFSKKLSRNKTYVITIGKDMKDVRNNNKIETPVTFAFSTGSKIDKGNISGKVFSDNYERVKILFYKSEGKSGEQLNPEKSAPDFITQASSDGTYKLTNLPAGNYRIFAISDEERNNLFDSGVDKIAVPQTDYTLLSDTSSVRNANFLLMNPDISKNGPDFIKLLKPDKSNFIYSNISEKETGVPRDYKFYFYFKDNQTAKQEIVNNFLLIDSAKSKSYRTVFNWINDSLLEVFTIEKLPAMSLLSLSIDMTSTAKKYFYEIKFETAEKNSFGKISGKILSNEKLSSPVQVTLINKANKFISYTKELNDSPDFIFDEVFEGEYYLFSFADENRNGGFDKGAYVPLRHCEKFILYDSEIKVKGGWSVDNIFLSF